MEDRKKSASQHRKRTRLSPARRGALALFAFALAVLFLPPAASALETDIFLAGQNVKPNVMILFDNSGSMNDLPNYDPNVTYPGPFDPTTVYHRCRQYRGNCTCRRTQTSWVPYSGSCGFVDQDGNGIDDRTFFKQLGNRLNYAMGGSNKLQIAKEVIESVLTNPANANVRFGLMLYNGDYDVNRGSLTSTANFARYHHDTTVFKSPCQDNNHANIISIVRNLSANGGTPTANRHLLAGRYFDNTFPGPYRSPIQYECQRNYIINITDGIPEGEGNNIFANRRGDYVYIESWLTSKLGPDIDPDDDGSDPDPNDIYINGGSDYFDDVAWVLFHQDLRPSLPGKQNVVTFTIGFDVNHPLLENAAQNGGGEYFTATTADELADALRRTLNLIVTDAQSFVAPVVPVNALKRTQSGDRLYIALFQPVEGSTFWAGNIKKYGIASNGDLVTPSGSPATNPDGSVKNGAASYWDTVPSGGKVTQGGVGALLLSRATPRKIYTYLGNPDLTSASNAFAVSNTSITPALLGVATQSERDTIIRYIHGEDAYDDDEDDNFTEKRSWILGDFVHSTPLVVSYGTNDRLVLAGANDGQLHAFDDSSGEELWSFVPPAVLPRLKELTPGGAAGHPFLVDGSPRLLETDSGQKIVVFGLRRGGPHYYALDVTSKTSPRFLWHLSSDTPGMEELGQAWSEPALGKMGSSSSFTYVAIFGGGYDPAYDSPSPGAPTSGRAVYVVNALNGTILHTLRPSGLDHPVPSNLTALDLTNDGTLDLAYVGDLGGNLWRIELPSTMTKIFSAPSGRRIFFAPDVVLGHGFLNVLFGTGDLTNPLRTDVENRLYLFRDDGLTGGYDEGDLVDITDNLAQEGSASQKQAVLDELAASKGWYFRLPQEGEKMLSSPLAFVDIFATTFTPTDDPCAGGGDARLYVLRFADGASTVDRNQDGTLDSQDRVQDVGHSIPTEVTPTIREQGAAGYIGVGGAIPKIDLPAPPLNVFPLWWREVY
ncbi:MAG: hypothetical protein KatS3mg076_0999 [Candidatus Binatia bacterium]|nr:MAG: hypothetical protein KatS3mg076_0999 [Candidatus Binatia bacterium]